MARLTWLPIALTLAAVLGGCKGGTKTEPQIGWIRNMHELPRYDPQEPSPYFEDGRAMRPPVAGTVSREMEPEEIVDTGLLSDGTYVLTVPEPVVDRNDGLPELIRRGQDRYGIYCAPCHGGLGNGAGLVGQRSGVLIPPTFHDDRIRTMPDAQIYATIRNGVRSMPSYRHSIPVDDRWSIVSYLRALQLSQMEEPTASLLPDTTERTR